MKRQAITSEVRHKTEARPKWVPFIFWSFVTLVAAAIIVASGAWISFVFVIVPGIFAWISFKGEVLDPTRVNPKNSLDDPSDINYSPAFRGRPGNIWPSYDANSSSIPPD